MNLLVSGTALLLASAGFAAYDLAMYRRHLARNLSIQAQIAGINSVSALVFNDPRAAQDTLAAFEVAPNIVSACIYTPEGEPFAFYRRTPGIAMPLHPELPAGKVEMQWTESGDIAVLRRIDFEGKPTGSIYVRSDLKQIRAALVPYAEIAAVVLAISLLAALLLSTFFRRSLAEPMARLSELVRRVSRDKDYSVRAPRGNEQGEVALLVDAFNEMLGQIEGRDRSLREAHDELERRVEERTAELAAANRELEAFSYSVSHDLRAPLRSIDGFALALVEDYSDKLDATGKEHLARVRAATQRMGMLIDGLLNLSRVTRAEIRRDRVDLSSMARSIARDLQTEAPDRVVEWVIGEGIEAYGDPQLLRVAMENLLRNSWKYTSSHTSARIEVGKSQGNGRSAFYVRDDGAGFNPAYSQKLFGAFQRLHKFSEFPGTGIGLATVQRIIHRHGGNVWAEGAVEKGATFFFAL